MVFSFYSRNAEARRGGRAVGGPLGGAVGGPTGNVPAQTPRGNVGVGTRFSILCLFPRKLALWVVSLTT